MNTTVPYIQDNTAFNPLYAKMRERFCSEGTLAERMAAEAGLCKKQTKKSHTEDRGAAPICTLPRCSTKKKLSAFRRSLFNLKNLGAISMTALVMGVLFLSGSSFDGIQKSFTSHLALEEGAAKVAEAAPADEALVLYCTPLDAYTAL